MGGGGAAVAETAGGTRSGAENTAFGTAWPIKENKSKGRRSGKTKSKQRRSMSMGMGSSMAMNKTTIWRGSKGWSRGKNMKEGWRIEKMWRRDSSNIMNSCWVGACILLGV